MRGPVWLPAVHAGLVVWGEWHAEHADYLGYPSMSAVGNLRAGRGGMIAGHRVLCLDMPGQVARVHRAWLTLRQPLRDVLSGKYARPMKADGSTWTDRQVAMVLGMSYPNFRHQVRYARQRIAFALAAIDFDTQGG